MTRSQSPQFALDCFRLAATAYGIGVAVVGLDGRWREVSPALGAMLRSTVDTLTGRSMFDAIHPDDVAAAHADFEALVAGSLAMSDRRLRCLRGGGSGLPADSFPAHFSAARARDGRDGTDFLIVQVRDLTLAEVAQTTAQNDPDEASAPASRRQVQMYVDAVAHDLRAPLRSIESFSSLLVARAGDALDPIGRDHLGRIRQAAARMGSLLTALGELSRASVADLKPSPVDLSLLADWVAAELQDAHPEQTFQIRVQPGLSTRGDEHLLKLLLTQLLDNARRFTPEGEPVCVEIDGTGSDGVLRLSVRDHGRGFDMRYLHKLFQPFQRLHGAEEGAGHGLGLAIAKCIAERHLGHLHAESEPGGGSTFHLELPGLPE
ncbi:MAG: sensor histidine kinase [Lysobacter sp.]